MKTKLNWCCFSRLKAPLLFTMKVLIFFFSFLTFALSTENGFSQDEKITFPENAIMSIEEVLDVVKKQTEYNFIYRSGSFDKTPKIKVKKGEIKIVDLFREISKLSHYNFKLTKEGAIYVEEPVKELSTKKDIQKTVTGTVLDSNNTPLPGANIIEKGTSNGVTSDFDGNFSLNVSSDNAILVISYIGFTTKEVTANTSTPITIRLIENAAGLDEVVVVGYGSKSRKKITSAISEVDLKGAQDMPNTTAGQAMQGRVSGVIINDNSGTPGEAPAIRVRGISSINAGTQPLVVIDGFPIGNGIPQSLNPNDIESITVLKDAASTSIYGARGSNGVILIQTIKAKEAETQFTYSGSTGIQSVPNGWRPKVLNARQYAQYNAERVAELNDRNGTNNAVPQIYLDALNDPNLKTVDWQDFIFRDALFQDHNVTFRGGNSKFKGAVSGGYLSQEGVLINSDFKRYSLRTNLDANVKDWLKVGSNVAVSFSENNLLPEDGSRGIIMKAITSSPLKSPYDENGDIIPFIAADSPGYFARANPLFEALERKNNTIQRDINASINLDITLLPGLHYKPQLYGRVLTIEQNTLTPTTIGQFRIGNASNLSPGAPPFVNTATNSKRDITNWGVDNLLSYDNMFGDHSVSALLGYTAQKQSGENTNVTGRGFPSDDVLNYLEAAEVTAAVTDGSNWSLAAFFARVGYDYKSKYLVELNFRREGSSRFGTNNKYGNFPSASVGWRVSEEDFFPEDGIINELKLRGSYGITGNSAIGDFDRFGNVISIPNANDLSNNFNYVLNDNVVLGKSLTSLPSSTLQWETSTQLDIGMEMALFDSAVSLNVSYFKKTTEDMLFNLSIPAVSGFGTVRTNVGEMENTGLDLELGANLYSADGNFSWNGNLNLSFLKNEVTSLPDEISEINSRFNVTRVGLPVGSLRGWTVDGIFTTQAQLDDPNLGAAPGSRDFGAYIFRDINEDGTIDGLDQSDIGNPHPKVILGFNNVFNYKNFSLSVLATGMFGYDILPQANEVLYNAKGRWNVSSKFLNRFISPDEPGDGLIPGIHFRNTHQAGTHWLEKGDHLWIRNITFGYKLPQTLLDKVNFLTEMRLFLSVQNAAKFTNYSGWNPQVSRFGNNVQQLGIDEFGYPTNRTFTFGANIKF
ncbi:TonB-linked SusC/RagA family outer membrane protein [Seonamhaeicola aphaedonensis]|uniref:TonB-linked SusC/RagA family outer membrane protein n=2 Tax=Seonamhaeicola aphaedonensis TaxID=1461338 RepID=A0A3D9HED2_9FLAO|nr:TonB-linked SusC/RagA family outer membrane protein [Seonamhaeicola aphaedonensis]